MRAPKGLWKWVGLAGVAGVAATGAVVVRDRRQRQALTPEQVRSQLHRRLADLDRPPAPETPSVEDDAVPHVPVKRRRR